MKKLLNLLLLITSLFGYLEWGGNNQAFLFEAEKEMLARIWSDKAGMANPFVTLPLLGQVLLMVTLFQRQPGRLLTFAGMFCIGILMLFMLFIGITGQNIKIALSVLPFLFVAGLVVYYNRKKPS